ncbi:DUF6622 family protein [Pseudovibrio exalbescens]|uniref:DUF6622 family protein n=1 Tax=Pseudovibrio exalbescens TaxID=197461 RepID=UPI000C9A7188|nr:DUF6622 family protein [Pseudovibrio exalbescens]
MLLQIVTGAPVWVWPLLALLIWAGLRSTRPRQTRIATFLLLPLIGIMSANSIASLANPVLAWTGFAVFYIVGMLSGFHWQRKWLQGTDGAYVQLAGEWLTLAMMMAVFWANFARGVALAIEPALASAPVFIGVYAGLVSFASGTFTGRAIRVVLYAHQNKQSMPAPRSCRQTST